MAYVRFRVWRRLIGIDPVLASRLKWSVLRSVVTLSPISLLSRDYWGLRVRILGRFVLNGIEAIKSQREAATSTSVRSI
jgi:hypothetical protein